MSQLPSADSERPTATPSASAAPSEAPTVAPTQAPSESPTIAPTQAPSVSPTQVPSETPTIAPTQAPSESPTIPPTQMPSDVPSAVPTFLPTASMAPSDAPSSLADCNVLNGFPANYTDMAAVGVVGVTYAGLPIASPGASLQCATSLVPPPPAVPLPNAEVLSFLTIDPMAVGCITLCIGLGDCAPRVLNAAVFDSMATTDGNTVFAGDIQTGLLAITGNLPFDGSPICVSYVDNNVGANVFLVDGADNSAVPETPPCFPTFSIFLDGVCVT